MNYLITGGTGLIGRTLINEMVKDGHQFTVLTRSIPKARKRLPDGCKFITSLAQLDDIGHFDGVINLAGEPIADKRWTPLQKRRICESRWDITAQLAARINDAEKPPGVFISGSAVGYYGRHSKRQMTEHNYHIHNEFTHEVCKKWEEIALSAQSDQTRVCVLRTGIVLARKAGALGKMRLPFLFGAGGKMGDGQQYMSWIHIDDMIAGIRFLLDHEACQGAYNFTAPKPERNETFTYLYARSLHRPSFLTVPAFSLRLLMGEAADLLLTGQNIYPARLIEAGFKFTHPTLRHAFEALRK